MKKINIPLIIGSVILLAIIMIIIFPEFFTNKSPYTIQQLRFLHVNGESVIEKAPYVPDKDLILGSDEMGRDIWSYMVYGTRLTLTLGLLMALGQFLVAIPIALLGGFGNRFAKSTIMQFNVIFSAIPALLISIILLKLDFFVGLNKQYSIIAFVIVMTIIGWAKIASIIIQRVEAINQLPFIRGEVAIGKRRWRIALENVIPHLAPEVIILFFMEIARDLTLIMQLGIFGVFVGNLRIIMSSDNGILTYYNTSFEPEWASMLGTSKDFIRVAPWAVIFPATAFFITVLGFNLFGEGLRNVLQKKDSKAVSTFRKIITGDIKGLWQKASKKSKISNIAISVISIVVLVVILFSDGTKYKFTIEANPEIAYDQVIIGTEEAEKTAEYIAGKMNDFGIEPMNEGNYLINYGIGESYVILNQSFQIALDNDTFTLEPSVDYTILTAGDQSYTGEIYDASKEDLLSIDDYSRFENLFVMIDEAYYNDMLLDYIAKDISEHVNIKGILKISREDYVDVHTIIQDSNDIIAIRVTREVAELLISNLDSTITIKTDLEELTMSGNNIIGIKKGVDENIGEEAILIGMSYNYLNQSGEEALDFNIELMQQLCQLENNKRSIIFMFLDGTISEAHNGIYPISQDFPYSSQKIKVFIDFTGIDESRFDHLEFSMEQAPFTRQFAWTLGHHLEEAFNKNDFEIQRLDTIYISNEYYFTESPADNVMFWDRGLATIIVGTEAGPENHDTEDIGSILLEAINMSNY